MPTSVRDRLTARVAERVEALDRRGLSDATIMAGAIGADARAIGGAALPLITNFARDREVLFKDVPIGLTRRPARPLAAGVTIEKGRR